MTTAALPVATAPTAAPVVVPPTSNASEVEGDFQSRLSRITEEFRGEVEEENAEALDAEAETAQDGAGESGAAGVPAGEDPPVEAGAETRAARIKRITDEQELRSASKRKHSESDKRTRELEAELATTKARAARVDALEQQMADGDWFSSEVTRRLTPDQVADLIMRQSSPAYLAEQEAKKASKPTDERVAKLEAELAAMRAKETESKEQERQKATYEAGQKELRAALSPEATPLATRLLARNEKAFWTVAARAADGMFNQLGHVTKQGVAQRIEQTLIELRKSISEEGQQSPTSPGAAKPKPLTNRAASERSTLTDEGDGLSYRERVARANARVRAGR